MIDWLIDCRLIDWLFDCSVDWLIVWLIHRLIDWLISWLIDWLFDWLIGWLIDWFTDWLIDWSFSASIDGLIDWLLALSTVHNNGSASMHYPLPLTVVPPTMYEDKASDAAKEKRDRLQGLRRPNFLWLPTRIHTAAGDPFQHTGVLAFTFNYAH